MRVCCFPGHDRLGGGHAGARRERPPRRRAAREPHVRPDVVAQPRLELDVAFEPAPERFRRHAHHDVGGLAGHDVAHGVRNGFPDLVDEGEEHVVRRKVRLPHEETREVPGHALRDYPLAIVFDAYVRRGDDDADAAAGDLAVTQLRQQIAHGVDRHRKADADRLAHLPGMAGRRDHLVVDRRHHAGVQEVRAFRDVAGARDTVVNGPIDIKIGPDGALYFVNWGSSTYPTNSGSPGSLVRLAYTGVQTAVSPQYHAAHLPTSRFEVLGSGMPIILPAGAIGLECFDLKGSKVWSYRRTDATNIENVQPPSGLNGVLRVRWIPE